MNAARERLAVLGRRDGAAAERDHGRLGLGERRADRVRLDLAEALLPALLEELRDRLAGALLDRVVEVEERAARAARRARGRPSSCRRP